MAVTPEQDNNFSNVTWSDHVHDQQERALPPDEEQGHTLDGPGTGLEHDPNTLGGERLDCTVDTPMKENDGTKDAFVSYLITTNVRYLFYSMGGILTLTVF